MDWPLRDLFLAYVARMTAVARREYDADLLVWAVLAAGGSKQKQPEIPHILKGPKLIRG